MADPVPDDNCRSLRRRYQVGQIVEGVVVEHREFGIFLNLGDPDCLGVVLLPMIEDPPAPRRRRTDTPPPLAPGQVRLYPSYPAYPPLGSTVRCVLNGFATMNSGCAQPRLSMRASDLQRAADGTPSDDLPR